MKLKIEWGILPRLLKHRKPKSLFGQLKDGLSKEISSVDLNLWILAVAKKRPSWLDRGRIAP